MVLDHVKIALEIKVGITLQAIVEIQILIEHGVVPNFAVIEFEGY